MLNKKKLPNGYWTRDRILEEAKKYKNLKDFYTNSNGAYCAARKLGILEDVRNILPFHCQVNGYWTYERCLEESKKYKTRIEFHDLATGAYSASVKNGWIKDFNLISTRSENYAKTYTLDELNSLSNRCFNKAEFKEKHYHAYTFARKNKLLNDLEYLGATFKMVKYGDGKFKKIINPKYVRRGIIMSRCKYSYDKLYEIAKRYISVGDFAKNEPSAYTTANRRGWMKDYTWLKRKHHFYTEQECYNIAKGCRNIIEFLNINQGAYAFALKNNLLDTYDWFSKVNSSLEREMEDFLLLNDINYEKQKKFNWLKYKKPQSLDFYLPDFKVAIECQGIQHFKDIEYFKLKKNRTPIKILDSNKKKLCEQHGIPLIYFSNLGIVYPYKVYESKEEILDVIKKMK